MPDHPQTRRPLDFQDLGQVIGDVQDLRRRGYTRAGNWTLAQVADHLAIFFRGSLEGFSRRMPWIVRALVGKPILGLILRKRRMRAGVQVPQVFLPGDPRDDEVAVEQLVGLIERFRNHTGPLQPSPLFCHLTRQQWTDLHLIHAAHHLSFLLPADKASAEARA